MSWYTLVKHDMSNNERFDQHDGWITSIIKSWSAVTVEIFLLVQVLFKWREEQEIDTCLKEISQYT